MLPIAENLSVYIVSSFEIRQYSCTPRLHKRKNFLAMGQRFCKKTVLLSGAAPDRGILTYCERRATMPITAPFLKKALYPDCIVYRNNQRVVYSNDGLIFVTYDHYKTFFEIV